MFEILKKEVLMANATALAGVYDSYFPKEKRIFEDDFSLKLLNLSFRTLFRFKPILDFCMKIREKTTPGVLGGILCRKRYIDDTLKEALKNNFESVVNLGAGMDSRAFRIPGIEKTSVFEVDLPSVMGCKKKRLEKIFKKIPEHVKLVPIDFESQKLGEELKKAGYDPSSKTFFIWEGVTQYITREAVDSTMRLVSESSGGSRLVFTYVLKGFIDGSLDSEDLQKLRKQLKTGGTEWVTGFDPGKLPEYLSQHSMRIIEEVGAPEYEERYLKPANRDLKVMEIERTTLAEVKD